MVAIQLIKYTASLHSKCEMEGRIKREAKKWMEDGDWGGGKHLQPKPTYFSYTHLLKSFLLTSLPLSFFFILPLPLFSHIPFDTYYAGY